MRLPALTVAAAILSALPLAGGVATAHDLVLSGQVTLVERNRTLGAADLAGVVVSWTPAAPVTVKPLPDVEMVTKGKAFQPHVLAVTRGTTVAFPNQDPILHNVFSVSGGNKFDLGLYRKGPGKTAKFDEVGVVRVFCNVHQSMVAYVVVLDTPYFTTPDAQGRFSIPGLAAGNGTLSVWYERGEPFTQKLTLPATQPVAVRIEATRPKLPAHTNKLGQSYSLGDDY